MSDAIPLTQKRCDRCSGTYYKSCICEAANALEWQVSETSHQLGVTRENALRDLPYVTAQLKREEPAHFILIAFAQQLQKIAELTTKLQSAETRRIIGGH